ncbi:hypothetical protein RhiirC2_763882 [Rhizophagus irregularis]|uniref:Uncharacterized protein n=1 Tax=Rhizophagus irregularis TaxID=588596 RepID=A0A2N1M7B0_9GLOM|nr:hypothetical protein RhiirC2_763882 [Rhizophagus irregularis]
MFQEFKLNQYTHLLDFDNNFLICFVDLNSRNPSDIGQIDQIRIIFYPIFMMDEYGKNSKIQTTMIC